MQTIEEDYSNSKTIGIKWLIDSHLLQWIWVDCELVEISYINGIKLFSK